MRWRRPLLLLLLTMAMRVPSFIRPIMDIDEAEYASIACRMLDGGLPYRDGVEIKFPGTLYMYRWIFMLFGRYNMLAVHIVCALCTFATALICCRIARRLSGEQAGWWAAALYAVFSVGFYSKMQAANTEMFAVFPAAIAVLVFLRGHRFVAGFFCGVAILFKQPVVLLPVGLAVGELVQSVRCRKRLGPALVADIAIMAGSAVVPAVVALYFSASGILDDAVFWTWTYIWHHYFPSVQDSLILRVLGTPVLFVLALAPAVLLAAVARGAGRWPILWWLLSMVTAGFIGGRMYGHYFLLSVPPLCVLAGLGAARAWPTPGSRPLLRRATIAVTALLAVGEVTGAMLYEGATDSFWSPKPDYRQATDYLQTATSPNDRVFVWGWFPALYVLGNRCPSTRFVYAHHLAGYAPNVEGKRGHSVPQGWQQLLEDLQHTPPVYVLDTSHGDYEFRYAPMEKYPMLWEFVNRSYTLESEIAGVRFYRHRN